jgi:hypothetical protein
MTQSDNATNMLLREFATALRRAREEETEHLREHMRNTLYGYQLLRDGLAELNAELREMRRADAAAAAHYPAAPNK